MSLATAATRFAGLPLQRKAIVSRPRPGAARGRVAGLVVAKLSAPKPSTPNYLAVRLPPGACHLVASVTACGCLSLFGPSDYANPSPCVRVT